NLCPDCKGGWLRPEAVGVTVGGLSLVDVSRLSLQETQKFFRNLELTSQKRAIGKPILREIRERLEFLVEVGLGYLTVERKTGTLSGGEGQRVRLATQIGSRLTGVLYVLDEPSIGLHQRDNDRLLNTLKGLRNMGNTVIVVEHDYETIMNADYVVDLGPGAGVHGGALVAAGTPEEVRRNSSSPTGRYLDGKMQLSAQEERRFPGKGFLTIRGARHHNLKGIDATIPLGLLVCVTGVSGSGKSTLLLDILHRALAQRLHRAKEKPGRFDSLEGIDQIDKVSRIDQSPIGRTPRSNPATYTGCFTLIRGLFSRVPEARRRGYNPGRFSFNVKGGRCEACQGDGLIRIEMHFLPDVYVTCQECWGKQFNRETLEVRYKGKSIADVLGLTAEQALSYFQNVPSVRQRLQTLCEVGLGYLRLGQPATTLSGGEAQRVKLSRELGRLATGRTVYILDEPTTGLHFVDVRQLLTVLNQLVEKGNTVIIIEHNLDVIQTADYL
ncbi:MAG: excinuclease ABC subunit UvrA, partial [Candidatus Binatia bacterium]|nr:excinuclease ABC subunit UvrA [Candidatus Binatia bacterium]